MKVAVVGSRDIKTLDLEKYIPDTCTEIVSGGAKGVDHLAAAYAKKRGWKLTEFLPEYEKYGRGAPIVRNREIVAYADVVLAFWNGKSRGTWSTIEFCKKVGKAYIVYRVDEG